MSDGRLLTRIMIRNYKSIAACNVRPASLSYLVGPNGSGKSNFLDALGFVKDALRSSLDHAIRERGGIEAVRRRSSGHPNHFAIGLHFRLRDRVGSYSFEVGAEPRGGFSVREEACEIRERGANRGTCVFRVEKGVVQECSFDPRPPAAADRLYLVNASGFPEFRPVYDALSRMGFYNLNPQKIRALQPPDPGELLERDGSNLASVVDLLARRHPERMERIVEYLSRIVPGVSGVDATRLGPMETLEFRQTVRGAKNPWRFLASSMSDGTLRALGVLVALFQAGGTSGDPVIGIEEPETALHPAAAGILNDALRESSAHGQVLVTSHSPDLLDDPTIPDEAILSVESNDGETRIGPLDPAFRSILRDRLYTAGDLLRMDQLRPDPDLSQPDELPFHDLEA